MAEPHFNGPLAKLLRSAFAAGYQPDPWPAEIDAAVRDAAAIPVCSNCLAPQADAGSFCPHCAFPTSDTVALNPYLQIFVVGEVLRRGVMGPPERRVGPLLFLVVLSLSEYAIFAPLYWYWMLRRAAGNPICHERRVPLAVEEL
jgi:hypothetical protein